MEYHTESIATFLKAYFSLLTQHLAKNKIQNVEMISVQLLRKLLVDEHILSNNLRLALNTNRKSPPPIKTMDELFNEFDIKVKIMDSKSDFSGNIMFIAQTMTFKLSNLNFKSLNSLKKVYGKVIEVSISYFIVF